MTVARDISAHYRECWVCKDGQVALVQAVTDKNGTPWDHLDRPPEDEDKLFFLLNTNIAGSPLAGINSVDKDVPAELGVRYVAEYGPLLLSRNNLRQWKKGVCSKTVAVQPAWGSPYQHRQALRVDRRIAQQLFMPDYLRVQEAEQGGALSKNFYVVRTTHGASVLCYWRWAVGYLRDGVLSLDSRAAHLQQLLEQDTNYTAEVRVV